MLNLDPGKLLVIGVVAIILLGPDRLPQVARQVGGAWRSFNEFRHRMESEVRNTMPDLPPTSEIARLARSPSALLNHLSNMSTDEAPDGSFQPPTPVSENGTAGAAAAVGDAALASNPPDAGADAQADRAAQPVPAPEPAPEPAPNHVERPQRAPRPSGVVVPGDPTLN
jgi:sec-independent protein translocase protein TatB